MFPAEWGIATRAAGVWSLETTLALAWRVQGESVNRARLRISIEEVDAVARQRISGDALAGNSIGWAISKSLIGAVSVQSHSLAAARAISANAAPASSTWPSIR